MNIRAAALAGIGLIGGSALIFAAPAQAATAASTKAGQHAVTTPAASEKMPAKTSAASMPVKAVAKKTDYTTTGRGYRMPLNYPVLQLQEALNSTGAGLMIDGMWGPKTDAALRAYQRTHGLVASGELTSHTRADLGLLG